MLGFCWLITVYYERYADKIPIIFSKRRNLLAKLIEKM